jgi:phage shock protein C
MQKKLYRGNGLVAGICAGLGDYFGIDPTIVRVIYVVVSLLSAAFPGILVYIILWFVIPKADV